MKRIIALMVLLASFGALADTAELVCAVSDDNNVSPTTAVKNLNNKLHSMPVKTVSQPVFQIIDSVYTYVCVSVTK